LVAFRCSFCLPPPLFYVPEGSCSSVSLLEPPAPRGELSLFRKLVSGAGRAQVRALGTPLSSARPDLLVYSVGFLFARLVGEAQVCASEACFGEELFQDSCVWYFFFSFFLSFWHSEWLNQGKASEAGR